MTRTFTAPFVILLASMAATAAVAAPSTYSLEPNHTFVTFEAKHFGTSTVRGRFDKKSGTVTLDTAAKTGQIDVTVEMGSISTGIDAFNNHLKSKDFFNAEAFPVATFKSSKLVFEGDKVVAAVGDLTLLGKTQTVTLKANNYGCYDNPMLKRQVCGGDFETTIQRGDFGMSYGLPFIPNDIKLVIQVEAFKQ